jgi:cardiolipin synthase
MYSRFDRANVITASRVVCAILLVTVPVFSVGFFVLYAWCGVSDVLDGWLARRRGASAFGARLDSVADAVFVVCVAIALIPVLPWQPWMVVWICAIAVVRTTSYAVGYRRFHTYTALHTRLNKLTGIVLFSIPLFYLFVGMDAMAAIACAIATVSAVEELTIVSRSSELDRDVKGLI